MTDRQFDILMMHSGMLQDGLASSEAIAYMTLMGEYVPRAETCCPVVLWSHGRV